MSQHSQLKTVDAEYNLKQASHIDIVKIKCHNIVN